MPRLGRTASALGARTRSGDGRSSRLAILAAILVVLAFGCVSAALRFELILVGLFPVAALLIGPARAAPALDACWLGAAELRGRRAPRDDAAQPARRAVCTGGADRRPAARGVARTLRQGATRGPRALGIVAALLVLGVVHGTLLIYFSSVGARFTFPALPIMAVLGLSGVAAAARRVAAPASALLPRTWPRRATLRTHAGGIAPGFRASPMEGVGGWVRRNLPPDAVIMARQPWELRFYVPAGVKTVTMPWTTDARAALGIAHHYGVTHVLTDPARPAPPSDRACAASLPHQSGDMRAPSAAADG